MGKQWKQWQTLLFWAPKSLQMVTAAMKLKDAYSLEEKLWPTSVQFSSVAQSCPTLCNPMNRSTPGHPVHHQLQEFIQTHFHRVGDATKPSHPLSSPFPPRQHIKKQRLYFANKGPSSQSYGVWMWELVYKESWALKNWCFWTVVLEKTPESPLDCREIQPVHPKGNQSWIFIGRTDAEAETPILWPPLRTDSFEKLLMLGKIEGGRKRDDTGWDGWMTSLTQWTWVWVGSGSGDGQEGLAWCSLWGHKESDTTEQLNWTDSVWPHLPMEWIIIIGKFLFYFTQSQIMMSNTFTFNPVSNCVFRSLEKYTD